MNQIQSLRFLAGLAVSSLCQRWMQTMLSAILVMAAIAIAVLTTQFNHHAQTRLTRSNSMVDIVVGAKGSPLQLILSSLYHADIPTGNIPFTSLAALQRNPDVALAIPLALGDSYQSYRIVGTTPDYLSLYNTTYADGTGWNSTMDAVLGADVARATKLKLGGRFTGSHGMAPGGHDHADAVYRVTGILQRQNSTIDRLILTDYRSVQQIHAQHDDDHSHDHAHDHAEPEADAEITAILVKARSHAALMSLPRQINRDTSLQAAVPTLEMARLSHVLGIGFDSLRALSALLLALAAFSIFASMAGGFENRAADLALLRALGAGRSHVFGLIILEALWIGAIAILPGLLAGHLLWNSIAQHVLSLRDSGAEGWTWLPAEFYSVAAALLACLLAALIPALRAYKLDTAKILTQ